MTRIFFVILVFSMLTSCVTRGKYNSVLNDIESKEKQRTKLQKQLEELEEKNRLLKDSAEKIGGGE